MVEHKQTYTLEYLQRYSICDIRVQNTKVILVRGDGEEFSINTTGVIDGVKVGGSQGPEGDQGPQGESTYDIAVRLGKTSKDLSGWLQSLVGDRGFDGVTGRSGNDGVDGRDAIPPEIDCDPITWLAVDEQPSLSFNRKNDYYYTLHLDIPVGKQGSAGRDGIKHDITTGSYTVGKEGAASIVDNKLNISIPSAIAGEPGRDSRGLDASAPSLDITVNYVNHDQEASVKTEKEPVLGKSWVKKITLTIPRGETGDKGPRGEQGTDKPIPNSSAILKIISDINEIQDPGRGFCTIAIDNLAGFQGKAYGYSWRTDNGTFQAVNFVDTINGFYSGWWYRTGPATGKVDKSIIEGWKRCRDR